MGEVGLIAYPVFVETGDDAVAVCGYHLVEPPLGGVYPVVDIHLCLGVCTHLVAEIEVTITQRLAGNALVDPIVIHAKGTEDYPTVMAAQIAIDGLDALGLELKEHGVDKLHHIIAPQSWQQGAESYKVTESSPLARTTHEGEVAGIVFPEVAVGQDGDLMAQLAQAASQGPVYIAVFADEKYAHNRYLTMCNSRLRPILDWTSRRNIQYLRV